MVQMLQKAMEAAEAAPPTSSSENKRRQVYNSNANASGSPSKKNTVMIVDGAIETLLHSAQNSVRLMESREAGAAAELQKLSV